MAEYLTSGLCKKTVKEGHCVRRIRFSTSKETTAQNDDSILVYARLKPLTDLNEEKLFTYNSTSITYSEIDKRSTEKLMSFSFHKVFPPNVDQKEVFDSTVNDNMDLFIAGENRLIFAYGTTSSGKTYTMLGNTENPGILPRCIVKVFFSLQELLLETDICPDQGADLRRLSREELDFMNKQKDIIISLVGDSESKISSDTEGFNLDYVGMEKVLDKLCYDVDSSTPSKINTKASYALWITYAEVYNENIYDLLNLMKDSRPLKIGLDSHKNNYVKGLTHIQVGSWLEFWKVFLYGRSRSHMNKTNLNKSSSRSHSIFTLKMVKTVGHKSTINSLSVCDLAGTERQKKALNSGESLFESRNINTSLMILNRCFMAVRENKMSNHQKIKPPYRDSKLTMIFQKAFSYGEPITMFVALSQSADLFEESKNVLKMSAVAQEMVKPLPRLQDRFLKPNSRFSVLCLNSKASILQSQAESEISGVLFLSNSTESKLGSTLDEKKLLKSYETKIERLRKEVQSKEADIKMLWEVVEDGKSEYLNLEKKYDEIEKKLYEEEMLNEELEKDILDTEALLQFETKKVKTLEDKYNEAIMYIQQLEERNEHLIEENEQLESKLKEMEQQSTFRKKGRPLLNSIVHLDNISANMTDISMLINTDPPASSTLMVYDTENKAPTPSRKNKKN